MFARSTRAKRTGLLALDDPITPAHQRLDNAHVKRKNLIIGNAGMSQTGNQHCQ